MVPIALTPLILQATTAALDEDGEQRLQQCLGGFDRTAHAGSLEAFRRATLELFATIVSISPAGPLRLVVSSIVRTRIESVPQLEWPRMTPGDRWWRGASMP